MYGNRVWGLEVGWELSMTVWVWERRKLGGRWWKLNRRRKEGGREGKRLPEVGKKYKRRVFGDSREARERERGG